jgi:CRISPR-associated protein Csm4
VKLYDITLSPLTGFGTPLKGDTLFGQFCWQAAYDPTLLEGGLDAGLSGYAEEPFAIFSSAFPRMGDAGHVFKRPDMPLTALLPEGGDRRQRIILAKDLKAKKWMVVSDDLAVDLSGIEFVADGDLTENSAGQPTVGAARAPINGGSRELAGRSLQPHNTINRLTGTTGTGMFAPYTAENVYYYPGTLLSVFVLLDEDATDIDRVCTALERVGQHGFGRDASTGLGRFEVCGHHERPRPDPSDADACYTLAPSVPERAQFEKVYYAPFIRFGKHGDTLAKSRNPFKNPIIMADEGAVLFPKDRTVFEKPYLGRAVGGVSQVQPQAVVQGYTMYLPFKNGDLR